MLVTANVTLPWQKLIAAPRRAAACTSSVPCSSRCRLPYRLIGGRKSISGSPLGRPATVVEMLEFCARHDIAPQVERFPMSRANDAIERLRNGKPRYRIVLDNDFKPPGTPPAPLPGARAPAGNPRPAGELPCIGDFTAGSGGLLAKRLDFFPLGKVIVRATAVAGVRGTVAGRGANYTVSSQVLVFWQCQVRPTRPCNPSRVRVHTQ